MYALNLNNENRILSACVVLSNGDYTGMYIVDTLPDGDITDYVYINGQYVYEPLTKPEVIVKPSQLDIVEAQVFYTAMMTDTLLEG